MKNIFFDVELLTQFGNFNKIVNFIKITLLQCNYIINEKYLVSNCVKFFTINLHIGKNNMLKKE